MPTPCQVACKAEMFNIMKKFFRKKGGLTQMAKSQENGTTY